MTQSEATGIEPEKPAEAAAEAASAPDAEEVLRLMAERAAEAARAPERRRSSGLLAPLGFGVVAGLAIAAALIGFSANGLSTSAVILGAGAAGVIGVCVAAAAARWFSPGGPAGAAMRRAAAGTPMGRLAGADALAALGLAESVIECDPDARLVTRRDGVVVYANNAYGRLAADAGVGGPAGLPPRIDRLFAQQGAEASKVFRLCRAAKSAAAAEEIVYQRIGLAGGGARRRFEVSVRPVTGTDDFVAWRLRELPVEEERHDALAAAYADYVRGVFAMEKSGQIAWANQVLRSEVGLDRAALNHIDDFVLGETGDLLRGLLTVSYTHLRAHET
jgi:two-component system cell cycle sensor histidine kinase/response regulator CckA